MQHIDRGLLGVDLDDLVHVHSGSTTEAWPKKRWGILKARMQLATAFTCVTIGLLLAYFAWASSDPLAQMLQPSTTLLIAGVLLFTGIALSHRYARWRYSQSHYWSTVCPSCAENTMVRVPRLLRQRLMSGLLVIPFRNYACRSCPWQGTRVDRTRF